MEKQWYVIYTKSNCEKKVASILSKYNIENYCPLNRTMRQWADRKKMIQTPLFISYVFVCVTPDALYKVRQTSTDIINFVYWLGKPAIVKHNEIQLIKSFLDQYIDVTLEKQPIFVNDRIKVLSGPFMNMEGNVRSIEHNKVKITLPSLGYIMTAETAFHNVQVIRNTYQSNRMVS